MPGRDVHTESVSLDTVHGPIEVYNRARAWFMTMAFVAIRKPNWFDFQTAIFAADKIMDLVQQTSSGLSPPVSHFLNAWAATLLYFSEQVRISQQPLTGFVTNTGAWEHRWNWTAPAGSSGHGSTAVDLPPGVAEDVDRMRNQARQWQSMVDKQRSDSHKANKPAEVKFRAKGGQGGAKKKGAPWAHGVSGTGRDRDRHDVREHDSHWERDHPKRRR